MASGRTDLPRSVAVRVGRAMAGLVLGYFGCSLALLGWLLVLTAVYGDMGRGLELLPREPWADVATGGAEASALAAWAGGFGGACAFGAGRARRTVLIPIALGGALSAVVATPLGAATAWLAGRIDPLSRDLVLAAPALAVPAGFAVGLVVGRHLTHSPTLLGRWRRVPGRLMVYRDDTPRPRT